MLWKPCPGSSFTAACGFDVVDQAAVLSSAGVAPRCCLAHCLALWVRLCPDLMVIFGCPCCFCCYRCDKRAISDALDRLEVATSKDDISLRSEMAYGMFDTRGKVSKGPRGVMMLEVLKKYMVWFQLVSAVLCDTTVLRYCVLCYAVLWYCVVLCVMRCYVTLVCSAVQRSAVLHYAPCCIVEAAACGATHKTKPGKLQAGV
jgi:hypothetical protein